MTEELQISRSRTFVKSGAKMDKKKETKSNNKMAENVKVIVRCRPMNKKENELNCQSVVRMENCMVEIWDPTDGPSLAKQFTFDSVYDQKSATESIYNDICYPLIESVLEGYNSTIFVYGQTGCGKSFTMEGTKQENGKITGSEKGIIQRTFEHIFEAISVTTGVKYLALVSYLEIYNEQIRDLLIPCEKLRTATPLSLKEIVNEGVIISGLTTHPVHNLQECLTLLEAGSKNRSIGATLMNQQSSRSHSIFTVSLEQASTVGDGNENEAPTIRRGKLNLVDLAGSERQSKTGAAGDRLREATKINLSLSALGNVISALVDGKAKHIPYRDSKLTRLLQDSLGGNTRTLMIACISPSSRDYVETLSTLRYANRAKNIHNQPRVNEDPKDTMLRKYQEEISRLRNLLENQVPLNQTLERPITSGEAIIVESLDEQKNNLLQEYQNEMQVLKNLHENEKAAKETILKQMESIKKEYNDNLEKLNNEIQKKKNSEAQQKIVSKEEIMKRLQILKDAMIGGERANDKELSERRKRKKMASEKRLNAIANVLAKMDMDEDREILQNQYKDISFELQLKTDMLRKYKHRVKSLEKEIIDLQSEFEEERQDYLETIRKQDMQGKLYQQIAEKVAGTLKKECNYSDLDSIREQAIWLDETQKYKLPDIIVQRTKLPPAERGICRARVPHSVWCFLHAASSGGSGGGHGSDRSSIYNGGSNRESPGSDKRNTPPEQPTTPKYYLDENDNKKLERSVKEDIAGSYFIKPKRATELLNQSRIETSKAFNTWRGLLAVPDFAKRNKLHSSETSITNGINTTQSSPNMLSNSYSGLSSLWLNGNTVFSPDPNLTFRKPLRLEALPTVEKRRKSKLNTLDLI